MALPRSLIVMAEYEWKAGVSHGYLWWLDFQSNQLERILLSGGTRERLTEVHFGGPMAADADAVYWGDTSLKTIEKWTPAGGGQVLTHADPDAVVVADGIIYWTDGFVTGSIRSIHTDGTGSKPLLCGLTAPSALYVDGSYVVAASDVASSACLAEPSRVLEEQAKLISARRAHTHRFAGTRAPRNSGSRPAGSRKERRAKPRGGALPGGRRRWPDRLLELARVYGISTVRYDSADLKQDLATLAKLESGHMSGA
jgi:hypothetical protein